ncbi:MAG: hypothetical protein EBS05_15660 [Proteobacteria bacterium]|nr:hypothetical protein [Pseudomonadota bacterium]
MARGRLSATFTGVKLEYDDQAVRRFCQERGVTRLELFGSALGEEFGPDSDADLLCTVRPGIKCGFCSSGWP